MTVIAWDGATLAADRQGTNNGVSFKTSKLVRLEDMLIGISGHLGYGLAIVDWLQKGSVIADFPKAVDEEEAYLLVVHKDGKVERYENVPYPIPVLSPTHAMGCARDFAYAVMHLGHGAERAVEVACELSIECGMGIETMSFH